MTEAGNDMVPKEQYDALVQESLAVQAENGRLKNEYGLLRQEKEKLQRLLAGQVEIQHRLEHFIAEQAMHRFWRKRR
jgi:hypothetical protein